MRFPALSAAVLALCASALLARTRRAAGLNAALAAHRAIYNLTLSSSRGGDVVAATGTMGYEVIDACDGWAVRQRLSMTLTNTDGQDIQMVSDYATWESKDGLKFRFHMKQTTDTAVTSQTDGDAIAGAAGGPGRGALHGPRGHHQEAAARHAVPDGAHLGDPRGGAGRQEIPRPAAVRRHRRFGRGGQLRSSFWTGRSRRPTNSRCCPICPARASAWHSSTTIPRARCRPIRSACATGRTAWPTTFRWTSATS